MKTFGPFTGRQLTTIIVALIIGVVALPASAWALSFTNVAITDPAGVNRAKVSTGGALSTSGTATPATPANLVRTDGSSAGSCSFVYAVPAGKALVLTSASVVAYGNPAELDVYRGTTGCNDFLGIAGLSDSISGRLTTTDLGSGVAVPAGSKLYAYSGQTGTVYLRGYLVAASAVPAGVTASTSVTPGSASPLRPAPTK
jgi:hypothetical protein